MLRSPGKRWRPVSAARPSFDVSYPALKIKRDGRTDVAVVRPEGVLYQGLEWIVRQLARHGVVRLEFE